MIPVNKASFSADAEKRTVMTDASEWQGGRRSILGGLLYRLYAIRSGRLRSAIEWLVRRLEGGEWYSITLRRIFADYNGIEIGLYSYGGCFGASRIARGTKFGRYCSIAREVYIYNGDHPLERFAMHPFFYNPVLGYVDREGIERSTCTIGSDVWIGQNAIILPGVRRIGDGAVIGAGTIVTKEVPAFAVVVGNPGRVLRSRFDDETAIRLQERRWWDKDIETLMREQPELFTSPPLDGPPLR